MATYLSSDTYHTGMYVCMYVCMYVFVLTVAYFDMYVCMYVCMAGRSVWWHTSLRRFFFFTSATSSSSRFLRFFTFPSFVREVCMYVCSSGPKFLYLHIYLPTYLPTPPTGRPRALSVSSLRERMMYLPIIIIIIHLSTPCSLHRPLLPIYYHHIMMMMALMMMMKVEEVRVGG